MAKKNYSVKDLFGNWFYEQTLKEVKENFFDALESAKLFNENIKVEVTPVESYCDVEQEKLVFPFPFAKRIKKMHAFVKGQYPAKDEMKKILMEVKDIAEKNIVSEYFTQEAGHDKMMQSKLGFLFVLCEKRIKLLEGKDLSAKDLGILMGVSNQGIVQKISRGKLDAKKVGVAYRIDNYTARQLLIERQEFDYYDNLGLE